VCNLEEQEGEWAEQEREREGEQKGEETEAGGRFLADGARRRAHQLVAGGGD
jgi:hypothetical protein